GGAGAAALLAREPAVDHDEAGDLVGKIRGEGYGQPARGRMPHDDRPLPLQLGDDREHVAHVGVDGIVLARAPAGLPKPRLSKLATSRSPASASATPTQS